MAKLTTDDVLKLARLARLSLSPAEIKQFKTEINTILGYVEQLQAVDVSGLEPTYQVAGLTSVMRADVVNPALADPEALLQNAPATEAGHIKVKRILL